MTIKFYLSTAVFVLFSSILFAQKDKDYVVTVQRDTIYGSIELEDDFSKTIQFKASSSASYKIYTPEEVSFFVYGGERRYKVISDGKNKIFSQILVEGPISLYKVNIAFYMEKDLKMYKLVKKDTVINNVYWYDVSKEDKKYVGIMRALMIDCKSMGAKKFSSARFSAADFSRLVSTYNSCVDPQWNKKVYKEKKAGRIIVGLRMGYSTSDMWFHLEQATFYGVDFTPVSGFTGGFYANVPLTKHFTVQPELQFIKKGGSFTDRTVMSGPFAEKQEAHYDISYLQIPVTFRYSLGSQKLKPYGLLGFVFSWPTSYSAWQRQTLHTGGTTGKQDIFTSPKEMGMRFGAGISYEVTSQIVAGVEYNFETTVVDITAVNNKWKSQTHQFTVTVGYIIGSKSNK